MDYCQISIKIGIMIPSKVAIRVGEGQQQTEKIPDLQGHPQSRKDLSVPIAGASVLDEY